MRVLKRLGTIFVLILLIYIAGKGLLRLLPGDPVDVILLETGATIDPDVLRHSLGLDRAFLPSTLSQLRELFLHFNWGTSITQKIPIGPLLAERTAASLALAVLTLLLALPFSFLVAFYANYPSRFRATIHRFATFSSALSTALPTAWIGPILGFLLAVKFRVFSLTGGIALPVITLTVGLSGFWIRVIVETLERELRRDAVRTARAKGLSEWKVLLKHAFIPAAGPLVAYLGSQAGVLFAGAVITETLFDRPGLGSLLVDSIFKRDYPLIEAALITTSSLILIGNFLGDILQHHIEPRLRLETDYL